MGLHDPSQSMLNEYEKDAHLVSRAFEKSFSMGTPCSLHQAVVILSDRRNKVSFTRDISPDKDKRTEDRGSLFYWSS